MDRRTFLKNVSAAAGACAICRGTNIFGNSLAFASSACGTNHKTVVSIFLSGGPHGPSILVPRSIQPYFDTHPTLGIANSLALDSVHGLHPSMTNLYNLFQQGKVAIMNGAGYPDHSRSHEDSTTIMGTGSTNLAEGTGWAGRLAKLNCDPNEIFSLFSFRGNIAEVHAPGITAPTASSLSSYGYQNDSQGTNNNNFIRQTLAQARLTSGIVNEHQQAMLDAWETADSAVSTVAQVRSGYTANATYPGGIGPRLQDAARLISASSIITPKHIFIGQGGYDTHGDQAPSLTSLLTNLDQSINAFWTDMAAKGRSDDVVVMAYGEFGRTFENDNMGTDHGTGGIFIIVGNNVRGGVHSPAYVNGDFLGSDPWVPVKFDYREAIEQVIMRHQGIDPAPVFPEAFNRIGLNLFN